MRINELEDSKRLQLLIDGVIDYAIYTIDLDGNIVSWNSGAERLKGYSADEIIGRPFRNFFTPEDQEQGLPEKALATAAKKVVSRTKVGAYARIPAASGLSQFSTQSATRRAK